MGLLFYCFNVLVFYYFIYCFIVSCGDAQDSTMQLANTLAKGFAKVINALRKALQKALRKPLRSRVGVGVPAHRYKRRLPRIFAHLPNEPASSVPTYKIIKI